MKTNLWDTVSCFTDIAQSPAFFAQSVRIIDPTVLTGNHIVNELYGTDDNLINGRKIC